MQKVEEPEQKKVVGPFVDFLGLMDVDPAEKAIQDEKKAADSKKTEEGKSTEKVVAPKKESAKDFDKIVKDDQKKTKKTDTKNKKKTQTKVNKAVKKVQNVEKAKQVSAWGDDVDIDALLMGGKKWGISCF